MNDDFLHRIRIEPPADFLARLKSRLDRQPPPHERTRRVSVLRALAFGLVFGGSVFAITLLTVNGVPPAIRRLVPGQHEAPPRDITNDTSKQSGQAGHGRASPSSRVANGVDGKATAPLLQTPSITGSALKATITTVRVMTLDSLQEYTTTVAERARGRPNVTTSVKAVATDAEALAAICTPPPGGDRTESPALDIAVVTRRMTSAESDTCKRHFEAVSEVPMGAQAIVIVRSKLYGALELSPRDVFLALAAEVPDLAHSAAAIVPNPHTSWSQANGALENEPIEVIGPPLSSTTGKAFVDLLVEPGCRTFPEIAALEQSNKARYEQVCKTLRTDGAYVEMGESVFGVTQRLQLNPNAIGVTSYSEFVSSGGILVASPIAGTPPNLETIRAGVYPASRPLYAYLNESGNLYMGSYGLTRFAQTQGRVAPTFSMIPVNPSATKPW